MDKLELTKWYTNYIKELQRKYNPKNTYMLSDFPMGFKDNDNIELITKEEYSDYDKCYSITGAYRVTWESYTYPTTNPRDEGWSTRPCNRLEETTDDFPACLFEELPEEELKLKIREMFLQHLKEAIEEEVQHHQWQSDKATTEAQGHLQRIKQIDIYLGDKS